MPLIFTSAQCPFVEIQPTLEFSMSVSAGMQVLRVSTTGPFLSFLFFLFFFFVFSYIQGFSWANNPSRMCTLWGVAVNIALHYTSERNRTAKRKTMHFSVVKVRKQAEGAAQLFVLHGGDEHLHSYRGRGNCCYAVFYPSCFSHRWYGFILQMPFISPSSLLRSMHK